jgi:hypothetical protein
MTTYCLTLLAALGPNPQVSDGYPMPLQLTVECRKAPAPFRFGKRKYLVYELDVTSHDSSPLQFRRIDVRGSSSGDVVASWSSDVLEGVLANVPASAETPLDALPSGASKTIYCWVELDAKRPTPRSLTHKLVFDPTAKGMGVRFLVTPPIQVGNDDIPVVGRPLEGGHWIAVNGPSNTSLHRRAMFALSCRLWIGQRFAIDYVRVDAQGQTHRGDPKDNRSYHCYGRDVFAAASGTVVSATNDIPENVPGPDRAIPMNEQTIAGNHVIIQQGPSVYACYAHMIPGSVRVKVGQRVRRGQLLGKVGNSGNSGEPHLHMHLCDRPSFVRSEGIPYVLDSFLAQATVVPNPADLIFLAAPDSQPRRHRNELPLEDWMLTFDRP